VAVSIKDVARAAGVSYSTVSRALNDNPRVSRETRERIQRIAADMGYLPSAVAQSLVTQRTNMIGVVVTTITDLFFAELVHAIEETALDHHYGVILTNSRGLPERELQAIRALRQRRVDGIILVSGCLTERDICAEQGIDVPLVIINSIHREHLGCSVEVDNRAGGRAATEHLLGLGHRRIAHVAGPSKEWDGIERLNGYVQALEMHRVPIDPSLIVRGGNQPAHGIEAMKQLVALTERPTAVFCYCDATAMGAMRAARAAGLRVPQDLSFVGFDDIDLAPFFEPPLTTVAQPIQAMGEKAVEMVLALREGESVEDCVLPSQLVVRESTAPPGQYAVA
jgi:DNA-binding LacI/PurR family transcriptional regulator